MLLQKFQPEQFPFLFKTGGECYILTIWSVAKRLSLCSDIQTQVSCLRE